MSFARRVWMMLRALMFSFGLKTLTRPMSGDKGNTENIEILALSMCSGRITAVLAPDGERERELQQTFQS
jgi:hypothetical protein